MTTTIDESRHDTENCVGGADCPYSCPRKQFNREDWDLIRTALHMAAHEYLATSRDLRGIGPEADRCARQRNRISRMLPNVERLLRAAQNAELLARDDEAAKVCPVFQHITGS